MDNLRGGASQTEITSEEEFSESEQNSDDSSENVDNSDDSSTGGDSGSENGDDGSSEGADDGSDSSGGNSSGLNGNSGSSSGGSSNSGSSGEVSLSSTANDLGVYSDLIDSSTGSAVDYWISDNSYYSDSSFSGGKGTDASPYLISNAADLAYLAYVVFTGENKYSMTAFKQTADIDLSAHYWMPIGGHYLEGGSTGYYFGGKYDGNGYTISGLRTYYDSTADDLTIFNYQGLFGYGTNVAGWYFKNVVISSTCRITGYNCVAGVIGNGGNRNTIMDCVNYGAISGNSYVGGITTYVAVTTFIDGCENYGSVSATGSYCGGIATYISASYVQNCINYGTISSTGSYTGGIVGFGTSGGCYVDCNQNYGTISGASYCGGIFGCADNSCYIYGNCNYATVTSTGSYVGGVVGQLNYNGLIYDNFNTADVSADGSCVGGIVGKVPSSYASTENRFTEVYACWNSGTISGSSCVGGIVGYAYCRTGSSALARLAVYFYNCFNIGLVEGETSGGIVGDSYVYSSSNVEIYFYSCYYDSSICSTGYGEGSFEGELTGRDSLSSDVLKQSFFENDAYWTDSDEYGWDFDYWWTISSSENDGLPNLDHFEELQDVDYWISDSSYYSSSLTGSGTAANPYQISSAADLAYLSYNIYSKSGSLSNMYFVQTADIDLSAHWWMPIGGHDERDIMSSATNLVVRYDGAGYTISGLKTFACGNLAKEKFMGLFGNISTGSVYVSYIIDLNLDSTCEISGANYVGSLSGNFTATISTSYINNVSSSATVSASLGYAGGLTGQLVSTYIYDCTFSGSVSGGSSYVGGIVGYQNSGEIYANVVTESASISGKRNTVGGIVGGLSGADLTDSYNRGSVSGCGYVGGVVGSFVSGTTITVQNVYNTGEVSGTQNVAGLVGQMFPNGKTQILASSFNIGSVSAQYYAGGAVGYSYLGTNSSSYTHAISVYYGGDCTIDSGLGNGSLSTNDITYSSTLSTDCKDKTWFTSSSNFDSDYAWNFDILWTISSTENDGLPILSISSLDYWISDSSYYSTYKFSGGSGTEADPYLISCAADLAYLSYAVYSSTGRSYRGYYFVQTDDIDLSEHFWMPIGGHYSGGASTSYYFAGNYDGQNYTISGMKIKNSLVNIEENDYVGLFGYVVGTSTNYASIQNLTFSDCTVEGNNHGAYLVAESTYCNISNIKTESSCELEITNRYVGAVAGAFAYATISNCTNAASVTASGNCVGGVVGYLQYSTMQSCKNTGSVSGSSNTGGVVGYLYRESEVFKCSNFGTVKGAGENAGGILGLNDNRDNILHDCYNTGSVTGSSTDVGGICGKIGYYSVSSVTDTMYNCYNTGDVKGTYNVGGIVGAAGYTDGCVTTISNCFNLGSVTATNSSYYRRVGGIVGVLYNSATVKFSYYGLGTILGSSTTYQKGIGWDFTSNEDGEEGVDEEETTEYVETIEELAKDKGWFVENAGSVDVASWDEEHPWDFKWTWKIDSAQNDGYPVFGTFLLYDDEGYWYFEDGIFPQSVCDKPSGVQEMGISFEIATSSSATANVTFYSDDENTYAYVTIGSNSAWFLCEAVVWIASYDEDEPSSIERAVSKNVLVYGNVTVSADSTFCWTDSALMSTLAEFESIADFAFATTSSVSYDSFNSSVSQGVVSSGEVSVSSLLSVASVEEIDALGGSYRSTCTDFVAFLMSGGTSTSGGSRTEYWTRSLSVSLDSSTYYGAKYGTTTYKGAYNNGVYVTSFGTISNGWLTNYFGARLSISI